MYLRQHHAVALIVLCLGFGSSMAGTAGERPEPQAQKPATSPNNELDAFMEKVLARREVNRKTLEQYILDEAERFEILGPVRMPLHRSKREFT